MKHDENKIEEYKSKFIDELTYGGRGYHLCDVTPVEIARSWFIEQLKQYAEHMVQQERERITNQIDKLYTYCSLCNSDIFHKKCNETTQELKENIINLIKQ